MKHLVAIIGLLSLSLLSPLWAEEEKSHKEPHSHNEEEKHGHGDAESSHDEHSHEGEKKDAHDHAEAEGEHNPEEGEEGHEEGGANVGPDKGILEASEEQGIKLSPQALKNFEIRALKLEGAGPWTIPSSARLLAAEEVNLYRLRDGFFKRIDFSAVKKTQDQLTVTSSELKAGDEIVVSGTGFLRIAELAAFGGVAHGHSH